MPTISEVLNSLGLGQYINVFVDNDLDTEILPSLTEQDLEKLGVSMGHRKRLLKAAATNFVVAADSQGVPSASAESGERRQLTVMFCDMVGFTELASRLDPEVLQRIIRLYEDACAVCITRYEGYVFQRLGDGIVAFFGYPLAHEGEAERAILAGLAIVDAMANMDVPEVGRLRVRIGIATGVVVVASKEKGAVGETMNLASRLQGIAPVGSIVISERVRQLSAGRFLCEEMGEQTLKGIAQPLHAFRVVGASEASTRFDAATHAGLTAMVGRETEIALLLEKWRQAQEGEGQAVLLSGEAGIGKSRILTSLMEGLDSHAVETIRFQCSPYHTHSALYPAIDNLERALRFSRYDDLDAKLDKLEALLMSQHGRPRTDLIYISTLLSLPAQARYGQMQDMSPQRFKDETLRVLVDVIETTARRQPTLLLFEDAHWADPTSLEALDLLIDRVRSFSLLVMITHRPEFSSRWAQHGHVTSLNLSKLTRAQSIALIQNVTQSRALPANLLEQILSKTDGVPLFVEELTKHVLESGDLQLVGGRYEYRGDVKAITIPVTLRDSLTARLDRSATIKEIAQIGAAIGREFGYELLHAVAEKSKEELDAALTQLTDSGLAFRRGTPPESVYTFKHALVQDAAYDSMLKSRRQSLHARIAQAIESLSPQACDNEPELLAHHYTGAGMWEQAAMLWHRAGSMALIRSALDDAIAHLTKGLDASENIVDDLTKKTWTMELLTTRGVAHMSQKGWPAAEVGRDLSVALPLARQFNRTDLLVPILGSLFWNKHNPGPVRDSLKLVEEAFHEAMVRQDPDLELLAQVLAISAKFYLGELGAVVTHTEVIERLYKLESGRRIQRGLNHDPKTVAGAHCSQALWMLGYPDRALRMFNETNSHAKAMGNAYDYAFAVMFGAFMLGYRRDSERLDSVVEQLMRLGREQRMPVVEFFFVQLTQSHVLSALDRDLEAKESIVAHAGIWTSIGGGIGLPYWGAKHALSICRLGQTPEAFAAVDKALEQIHRPGWDERVHLAEILRIRGVILESTHDLEGAEQSYQDSLSWAREQQAKSWELRTAMSLAKLWRAQGRRRDAAALLAPIYGWFTEGFDTRDLIEAKALLAEVVS